MNRFEQVHVAGEEVPNILVVEGGGPHIVGVGGSP